MELVNMGKFVVQVVACLTLCACSQGLDDSRFEVVVNEKEDWIRVYDNESGRDFFWSGNIATIGFSEEGHERHVSVGFPGDDGGSLILMFIEDEPYVQQDFGITGTWDIRHFPRKGSSYISVDGDWREVDSINTRRGEDSTAKIGDKEYVFEDAAWRKKNGN